MLSNNEKIDHVDKYGNRCIGTMYKDSVNRYGWIYKCPLCGCKVIVKHDGGYMILNTK